MLKINGLRKDYGDFHLDCTMEVKRGRITGLVGANGAGKSTTFRAVLGLIRCDGGTVTLMGEDISQVDEKMKMRIGAVLSDAGFGEYLKVPEVMQVLKSLYPGFEEEKFRLYCRDMGIEETKKIKDFSTGMKAKLKCMIALTHQADFLILDEPTAGLDVMAREKILDLFRNYMEEDENRSILISSHISSDLEGLCDDIYLIHEGKIIFHEETDVLISEYGKLKVTPEQYGQLDKTYLLYEKDTQYGKECLTNQRQYYRENVPSVVVENCGIDEMILMMTGGHPV